MAAVSSSFLPEDSSFPAYVKASLAILRAQNPRVFLELSRSLAGQVAELAIDARSCWIRFSSRDIEVLLDPAPSTVTAMSSSSCIVSVLRGERTIRSAIQAGDLDLRGHPTNLTRFDRGLDLYVRGAVRCPAFEDLLAQYLAEHP